MKYNFGERDKAQKAKIRKRKKRLRDRRLMVEDSSFSN